MERHQARQLAEAVAWGRIAIGVTALVAPTVPLRPWVGRDFAWQPRAKLMARALGGRDLALGIGVILALRHDAPVRGWVEGGGLADGCDLLASLLAFGKLPKGGRWLVLFSTAGAVAAARLAAPALDDKP
jgi:hypothetical protein